LCMIEELWYKVHLLGEEYREKVKAIVEEVAREIVRQHDEEIEAIAESLGVRAALTVKVENTDPTKIYPCLCLVLPLQKALTERDKVAEEAHRMLGEWAYHARLRVEVVSDLAEELVTPKIKVWG